MNTSIKILIVDDFSTMRRIMKNILKNLGFKNLVEADDGSAAWALLEEQQVDLIIADWNMPEMTGLELLKKIRGSNHHKEVPFLMVTAEAQKEQVIAAIQSGVTNYVVKPFTAETISDKLERIINK